MAKKKAEIAPEQPELFPNVSYMATFGACYSTALRKREFTVGFESNLRGLDFVTDLKKRCKDYARKILETNDVKYIWVIFYQVTPILLLMLFCNIGNAQSSAKLTSNGINYSVSVHAGSLSMVPLKCARTDLMKSYDFCHMSCVSLPNGYKIMQMWVKHKTYCFVMFYQNKIIKLKINDEIWDLSLLAASYSYYG